MRNKYGFTIFVIFLLAACFSDFKPVVPEISFGDMDTQVVSKITRLRDNVKANMNEAGAWGKLGMNLYAHEFLREAAVCFEAASRLNTEDFRWPYFCAIALHNLGQARSLDWYRKAVELQPENPQLQVRMGDACLAEGNTENAARHFSKAIDLDESRADAYLGLAQINYDKKKYAEATKLLDKAIEIQPNLRQAHALLISCYRMQWQQEKVLAASKQLLQLKDEGIIGDPILNEISGEGVSFQWFMERGGDYIAAGQPDAAVAEFRRALEISPRASAFSQLGVALISAGKPDEAISNFQNAQKLEPESGIHNFNLGLALIENGAKTEGVTFLEKAYQKKPGEVLYSRTLFNQYIEAGRWADAKNFAAKVYQDAPGNINLGLGLAWLLATCPDAKLRDGKKAVNVAETILHELNRSGADALDCLAAAYAENGQYKLAQQTITKAIESARASDDQKKITELQARQKRYSQNRAWRSEKSFLL